ncbi:MAG: DUF4153 domain-containing protein [Pseudomonas sp.]
MDNAPASRPLILLGALQGALLWWLWHAAAQGVWPATQALWLGALLWSGLALPMAVYLTENAFLSKRRRLWTVALTTLTYAFFGAYAGWMGTPLETAEHGVRFNALGAFGQVLAAAIMGFVVLPLVSGRERGRWHYPRLFALAWRNAMLCASVAVVTGLFWLVLLAGAMLMDLVGVDFIGELFSEPVFIFPVTGMVVGTVFAMGHARAGLLDNLRHFWLTLNAWLLPLILLFGVMWVVALPFTGLEPLFGTRSAAFILLWFAALAVNFLNCAWQDGAAPPYPRWLATAIAWAWLALLVVAAVAGWALWLRIRQYGWTEERVWAVLVWLLAAGYALGYSLSLVPGAARGGGWLTRVDATNVPLAIFMVVALALMASPLADPRRLAVESQVARLHQGSVEPDAFDYHYLRWRSGRWGMEALHRLRDDGNDAIASRARQALTWREYYYSRETTATLDRDEARARIEVLNPPTETVVISDELVDFLREDEREGERRPWAVRACLEPNQHCALWRRDLDGDGRDEVLLLQAHSRQAVPSVVLLAQRDGHWYQAASIANELDMDQWRAAVAEDAVQLAAPRWPDLVIDDARLPVTPLPERVESEP